MVGGAELAHRAAARAWTQPGTLGDADCEELRSGLLGQPVNTASSIGYVAVGAWLLARTQHLEPATPTAARWYGALVALTGVGSVAYHGPQFGGAQLFHDLTVAGAIGVGVGVPVVRALRHEPVVGPGTRRRVWGAAALAAAAGLAYLGGRTSSPICEPGSVVQLHGLWHLCTAGAAGLWATALWPAAPSAGDGPPSAGGVQPGRAGSVDRRHTDRGSAG